MGEELKKNLEADIELVAGSNGVFEVAVDGTIIFSKAKEGRFPQPGEVIRSIQERG